MQHIPMWLHEIIDCIVELTFDTNQNLTVFEEIPKKMLVISSIIRASLAQKILYVIGLY